MNELPAATQAPPSGAVTLAIAGIAVAIACNDARLAGMLAQRYQAFLVPDNRAHVVAWFELDASLPPADRAATEIVFDHRSGYFATANCTGTIDLAAAHARLRVGSDRPISAADYFLRSLYALLAFRFQGLLFHAAGIVCGTRALLFFGHSGSGKTTIARHAPAGLVLNDDLVVLMPQGAGWHVHATPFWNPTQVAPQGPRAAPLAALLRLVQARHVALEGLPLGQALAELISCVPLVASDVAQSPALLERGLAILHTAPAYRLHFLPDGSFWDVVAPLAAGSPDAPG